MVAAVDISAPARPRSAVSARLVAPEVPALAAAVCTVLAFGLLAYTWLKISTEKIVAQQLPYVISGGLTGLGLIVVSAAVLFLAARRRDDEARRRQEERLVLALARIETALDGGSAALDDFAAAAAELSARASLAARRRGDSVTEEIEL